MPSTIKKTPGIREAWELYEKARPENLTNSAILPSLHSLQPQPVGSDPVTAVAGGLIRETLGITGTLVVTAATFMWQMNQWFLGGQVEEAASLKLAYLKPFNLSTVTPTNIEPKLLKSLQKRYDELVAYQMLKMSRGYFNTGLGNHRQENVFDDEKYFVSALLGLKIIEIARNADNPDGYKKNLDHLNNFLDLISRSKALMYTTNDDDFKYLSLRTLVVDLKREQKEDDKGQENQFALEKLSFVIPDILSDARNHISSLVTRLIKVATPFDSDEVEVYKGVKHAGVRDNQIVSKFRHHPLFESFLAYFLYHEDNLNVKVKGAHLRKFLAQRSGLSENDIPGAAIDVLNSLLDSKKRLIKLKTLLEEIMSLKREAGFVGLSHIIDEMRFAVEKLKKVTLEIEELEYKFHFALMPVFSKSTNRQFKTQFAAVTFNQSSKGGGLEKLDEALLLLTSLSEMAPQEIIYKGYEKTINQITHIKDQVVQINGSSDLIVYDPERLQAALTESKNNLESLESWIIVEDQNQSEKQPTEVEQERVKKEKAEGGVGVPANPNIEKDLLISSQINEIEKLKAALKTSQDSILKIKVADVKRNPLMQDNGALWLLLKRHEYLPGGVGEVAGTKGAIEFANVINNAYHVLNRLEAYVEAYKKHVRNSWKLKHNENGIANAEKKWKLWRDDFIMGISKKIQAFFEKNKIDGFEDMTAERLDEFNKMMENQIKFYVLHISHAEEYSGDRKHSYRNYLFHYTQEILAKDPTTQELRLKRKFDLKSNTFGFSDGIDEINEEVNQSNVRYLRDFMFGLQKDTDGHSYNVDYVSLKKNLNG